MSGVRRGTRVTGVAAVVAAVLALAPGGVTAAAGAQGKLTAHRKPATHGTHTTRGKPPATHTKKPAKPALPPAKTRVRVIVTTANLHQALASQDQLPFSSTPPQMPVVQVSEATQYQRMKGVGGAMTDTSAWLMYDQLAPGLRAFLMRRLFGHERPATALHPDPDRSLGLHRDGRALHLRRRSAR